MIRPKINSDKKRIIVDFSFPPGKSINVGIKKGSYLGQPFNFSLPSVSTLTDWLIGLDHDSWLCGADLARAYRQLRVGPLS